MSEKTKKLKENIAATLILIGLSVFLYFLQIFKIFTWTGEWHINVYKYHKNFLHNLTYTEWSLYILAFIVVAVLTFKPWKTSKN